MDPLYDEGTRDAVRTLKHEATVLADLLALDSLPAIEAWKKAVETRLLPRMMPEFPLVAAICGGGSSGKSTLFNTLAGESVSPTGGRAGINRRILISVNTRLRDTPGVSEALFDAFGCPPQQLMESDQLTTPGDPLLHYGNAMPTRLALLDTPDFDTGSGGSYQNREMAERSLQAADVLIYIFTNSNYNNRDNTDFIARMLTGVGTRKCFLVYRVYPSFTEEEVLAHAGTVGHNLYGDKAKENVLAVYRVAEDNQVANGKWPMAIHPVDNHQPRLLDVLERMDPRQVRGHLHRSVFQDVVGQGRQYLQDARDAATHLELYLKGLRTVQRRSVQEALGHLPMDAVVRRFSVIWQETDPSHVKLMRKTGRVVETPVRLLMRVARWVGGSKTTKANTSTDGNMAAAMASDFVRAANGLRKAAVDSTVDLHLSDADPAAGSLRDGVHGLAGKTGATAQQTATGTITVQIPVPPALSEAQAVLRNENWSAVVDDMMARQDTLLSLTGQLEAELHRLAHDQRSRMTTFDQLRQTFSAFLNIIPATAAVTYVLHTGDPIGAVGIKVKLAGLFGLNDLYALVAIPATAGMKKADLKQLETLLGPVAQAWLTHKLTAIEALFEEKITGPLLQTGDMVLQNAGERIASIADSLARCGRALEKTT